MAVEQLDVIEGLSAASGTATAVRTLVTDPRAPAARSFDELHGGSAVLELLSFGS
jgi:hypothetical protein